MRENVADYEGSSIWPEIKRLEVSSNTLDWFINWCIPNFKRLLKNTETAREIYLILDELIFYRDEQRKFFYKKIF